MSLRKLMQNYFSAEIPAVEVLISHLKRMTVWTSTSFESKKNFVYFIILSYEYGIGIEKDSPKYFTTDLKYFYYAALGKNFGS